MIEFITHYWLEVVFSALLAGFGIAYRTLSKKVKEQDAIKFYSPDAVLKQDETGSFRLTTITWTKGTAPSTPSTTSTASTNSTKILAATER